MDTAVPSQEVFGSFGNHKDKMVKVLGMDLFGDTMVIKCWFKIALLETDQDTRIIFWALQKRFLGKFPEKDRMSDFMVIRMGMDMHV